MRNFPDTRRSKSTRRRRLLGALILICLLAIFLFLNINLVVLASTSPQETTSIAIYFILSNRDTSIFNDLQMAASVESSCRVHRDVPHRIMVLADVPDLTKTHPLWRPVRDACSDLSLERYDMQQDLQQFATVWHWWQREGHEKMTGNQLSDLARYLILYTRGGIYIDIDFLTAKPLTGLSNVIAWQESIIKKYDNTGKQLNGAVLIADKGNQFLKQCIKNVPGVSLKMWEAVGPQLITDTFLRNEFSSDVMKALPAQSFYPVYWREVTLFMEDPSNDFVKKYKAAMAKEDNYGIHLWHKITKEYYPHNGTFFKELLATYSPGVLNVFLELHPDPNQYQKYLASQRKDT